MTNTDWRDRDHHTGADTHPETGQVMGRDFRGPTLKELQGGPDSKAWKTYYAQVCEHNGRIDREQAVQRQRAYDERRVDKTKWRHRMIRRLGAGVLAIAALATGGAQANQPGGLVDDYFASRMNVAQYVGEVTAGASVHGSKAVAQTMDDLARNDHAAIGNRAEEFRRVYKDQFVDDSVREDTIQLIQTAQTNEEIVAAMAPYASKYGVAIRLDDNHTRALAVEDVRRTAIGVVEAYQVVPTSVSKLAGYRSLVLTDQASLTAKGQSDTDGLAVSSTNNPRGIMQTHTIYINVAAKKPAEVFWHELGHGLAKSSIQVSDGSVGRTEWQKSLDSVRESLWDSPAEVSEYGTISSEENSSEYLTKVLGGTLAVDPHRARHFTSIQGKTALELLARLEVLPSNNRQMSTGYVDFLVAAKRAGG